MRGCEIAWDLKTADRAQALLRDDEGRCPCEQGRICPILGPVDLTPRSEA